jgi:hypothetical protein
MSNINSDGIHHESTAFEFMELLNQRSKGKVDK